ncbi:MAG: patatin-like phospholipase family protein [Alphaproteobacteria bacterium]|nr:patatin-like phospholipase family protein [Alphaproteobacteria bacterium]
MHDNILDVRKTSSRDSTPKKPIRILSIDGGGIRGLIPAMVLADIEKRTGKKIYELFDLIAGTSTGGLMALALCIPDGNGGVKHLAKDLIKFYEEDGKRVFSRSVWRKIRAVGNLADGKYSAIPMEESLKSYFGDLRLSQALTDVMISAYEMERRLPLFFKRNVARQNAQFDFHMWQVVRATTAAPTYFEPARLQIDGPGDYYALIDGAVFAFNPALCAFFEARQRFPDNDEFLVVSLGTGETTGRLAYDEAQRWGALRWAQHVFGVMCDGGSDMVDHQLSSLLPTTEYGRRQYYRFQARLETGNFDMDNASHANIRDLKLLAEHMIHNNRHAIRSLCEQLVEYAPESETAQSAKVLDAHHVL